MFTGLVQHRGIVQSVEERASGRRLTIEAGGWSHRPAHGESIAVNGCCLTMAEADDALLAFDVIHQTLRTTALVGLNAGDQVNLEHAATPATLLGGHIVQGHVDGVGKVTQIDTSNGEHRITIEPPPDLMPCVVPKGSIAIDGVSLTLAEVGERSFTVALIPTTLELTTLGTLRAGDRVNLETDYIAKIVVRWASDFARR